MGAYDNLNDIQLDVLREIGNIGSGNACTALSVLIGTAVDMSVPNIRFLDIKTAKEFLGEDNVVLGIMIEVKEDLKGMMFHIVHKDFAQKIINTFYPRDLSDFSELNEMDLSVLSEMGNITSGAYANSIATLTGMVVDIAAPEHHIGTIDEILRIPIEAYAEIGDKILVIDEQFFICDEQLTSNMILVLENSSLSKLFEKLGITG